MGKYSINNLATHLQGVSGASILAHTPKSPDCTDKVGLANNEVKTTWEDSAFCR